MNDDGIVWNTSLKKYITSLERIEYNTFRHWFQNRPLKNPDTAITSGLARNIARLIFEEVKK